MSSDSNSHRSCWLPVAPATHHPPLETDIRTEVAVIGGGIVGLTAALLLQRAGKKVVVLEADRIGQGTTGYSTAKLTSLQSLIYSRIEKDHGEEAARTYAQANEAGLAQVAELVDELNISCDFERQPALTYTCDDSRSDDIRAEAEAAQRAGLPAVLTSETSLPFAVVNAVRLDNQAQLNPYRYCLGLAQAITDGGGTIHERTRALDVTDDSVRVVETAKGEVTADDVVVATLLPFLDRGGFFGRTYPSRSYGISVRTNDPPPEGMFISAESPIRSVRPLPDRGGLIVVGENHKVGHDDDTRQRYAALEAWADQWFSVASVEYRWSAQDYMPADGLPYIGAIQPGAEHLLTATGFGKWGLTTGAAAAMIISDLIQHRDNPWAALFDTSRANLLASAKTLISENLDVAKRFVGDRLTATTVDDLKSIPIGEGRIVEHNGEKLAAFHDSSGLVHTVSPICTHMGCYVQWNSAEESWDCPCHGSRFDCNGRILQGPAVKNLDEK